MYSVLYNTILFKVHTQTGKKEGEGREKKKKSPWIDPQWSLDYMGWLGWAEIRVTSPLHSSQ